MDTYLRICIDTYLCNYVLTGSAIDQGAALLHMALAAFGFPLAYVSTGYNNHV